MADRDVTVRLRADIGQYQRQLAAASAQTSAFGKSTDSAGKSIDRLSGRLRLAADAGAIFGSAIAPLGAAAVGGLVAMTAQLGALAGAMGVTVLAVAGLGDGLKALDKYQLEPTKENFIKLQQEMKSLGPAGEDFVRFLDSIEPNLKTLQNAAREGLFPGAQEGIESLMQRLPEVRKLIREMATTMGDLSADAGSALSGKGFDAFFKYLRTDGIKILDDTSRTLGNLAEAAANTFAAFGGVSTDFSGGLLKFSQGLAEASANLESNAGFQEFVAYIQTEGPHVVETLGSLGNALLQIVEATAPLGGPVLTIVGQFADAIAKIADSDIGTPLFAMLAALALLNRSMAVTASLTAATFGGPAVASMKGYVAGLGTVVTAQQRAQMTAAEMDASIAASAQGAQARSASIGKLAVPVAGLAASFSGVADSVGLSNTAMLAVAGPWGAAAGFALDLWNATDKVEASIEGLNVAMKSGDLTAITAEIETAAETLKRINDDQQGQSFGESFLGPFAGLTDSEAALSSITGKTGDLTDTLADARKEARELAEAQREAAAGAPTLIAPLAGVRKGLEEVTEAAQEQEAAIRGAIEAMHAMREEALRAANAELDYQASIDDANAAIKENGKTHDKTTEKGRANLQALYNLAATWNSQSEVIKGNSKALQGARDNFIKTAEAMGISEGAARRMSREFFDIPEARQTKMSTPGMDEATSKAKTLKQILDSLHSKDINIAVHYQMLGNKPKAPIPGVPNADGGTVPKSGRGYADRYSYLLADGEEVISNRHGQADKHRSLLKAINAGRMADGGTAGGGKGGSFVGLSLTTIDGVNYSLTQLQNALEKAKKSLDKETQARDELQSQFDSIKSQVGGAYSTLDPFAAATQSGSVWGAGGGMQNPLGVFDAAIAGNTASTQAAQQALAFAAAHGLDGPLYAALAASGNLPLLQQFAALSNAEIDQREQAFAAQSNAQSALGTMAANAQVGAQLATANKLWEQTRDEVRGLRHDVRVADKNNQAAQAKNAKDVKDGVNGAASHGHGRGR